MEKKISFISYNLSRSKFIFLFWGVENRNGVNHDEIHIYKSIFKERITFFLYFHILLNSIY